MSSTTPNLGLLKKDPTTERNDTFNIKTMMNDNWDKIDAAVTLAMEESQAGKQAGNERKAEVVAALVAKGIQATTGESWATLITKITAIVTATGTAVLADVLAGKTFSTPAGSGLVGTMTDRRGANQLATGITSSQAYVSLKVPKGYYSGDEYVYRQDVNFISANIRAGKTILGVVGSPTVVDTLDARLDPRYLLTGYSGYDDGVLKQGTMVSRSGGYQGTIHAQASPTAGVIDVLPFEGYWDGATYGGIQDPDFIAPNIKKGVDILGIVGTLPTASHDIDGYLNFPVLSSHAVDAVTNQGYLIGLYNTGFVVRDKLGTMVFSLYTPQGMYRNYVNDNDIITIKNISNEYNAPMYIYNIAGTILKQGTLVKPGYYDGVQMAAGDSTGYWVTIGNGPEQLVEFDKNLTRIAIHLTPGMSSGKLKIKGDILYYLSEGGTGYSGSIGVFNTRTKKLTNNIGLSPSFFF